MRLIDADALHKTACGIRCGCEPDECGYEDDNRKYCEIAQYIEYAPTIEAVPLKPLSEWLARYCMPPQNTPIHDIFCKSREEIYGYLTVEWEQFLRGMNWEEKGG